MISCARIDSEHKQLYFQGLEDAPVPYQDSVLEINPRWAHFQAAEVPAERVFEVFVKKKELHRIGISVSTWDQIEDNYEKLNSLVERTSVIDKQLGKAAAIVAEHVSERQLTFFTSRKTYINRVINSVDFRFENDPISMHLRTWKAASEQDRFPGIYIQKTGLHRDIFINVKGSSPIGGGSFGKIKKAIWLSAGEQNVTLVAKKVLRKDRISTYSTSVFDREIRHLKQFRNTRGIIHLIAGGVYNEKYAAFFPVYEYSLFEYFQTDPFVLITTAKVDVVSQLLDGLTTLSHIGVHGDLSPKNILLKRGSEGMIEAVIADFGAFRSFGREEYGLTTLTIGSPEYFAEEKVTSKLDVWLLGHSLYLLFLEGNLIPACWELKEEKEIRKWVCALLPDWILKGSFHPETPPSIKDLINRMLDPRFDQRPAPNEAFELFLRGQSSCEDVERSEAATESV